MAIEYIANAGSTIIPDMSRARAWVLWMAFTGTVAALFAQDAAMMQADAFAAGKPGLESYTYGAFGGIPQDHRAHATGNPLRVTRVWVKRNSSWVETLGYQTAVARANYSRAN